MRFLIAFFLLLFNPDNLVVVGWAMFLCLWKITDQFTDSKEDKP
jgi:hypothetical protein